MDFDYLGWVPCLTGRLFLSHTNCGLGTHRILSQVNHINMGHNGEVERYLLLSSEVDWRDTPGQKLDGEFTVVLIATSPSESSSLHGYVLLTPKKEIDVYAEWKNIKVKLADIDRSAKKREDIRSKFSDIYEHILSISRSHDEAHKVYFSMGADGLVYLSYIPEKEHQRNETHAGVCARQAYYYLKYSIHKHQHHHYSDDSLTTIHRIKDGPSPCAHFLLEDLKRALVKLKRNFENIDHSALSDAQGITAYALSLSETLRSRGLLETEEYEREISYFNNTRHSLDASAQRLGQNIERTVAASGYARSIILFVLAVLGPLAVLYKDKIIKTSLPSATQNKGGGTGPEMITQILHNIFSSDITFLFFVINLTALYWTYSVIHSRYGTFILAFRRLRYTVECIVQDPRKGAIISTLVFIFGTLLLVASWAIILENF